MLIEMTETELNQIWDTLAKGHPIAGWISWPHQNLDILRHRSPIAFKTWKRESKPRTAWSRLMLSSSSGRIGNGDVAII